MLNPIKKVIENPDDIPNVPRGVIEYLQVQFNAGFYMQQGQAFKLKQAGYSEAYIAGFLGGLQYASQTLDDMEYQRRELAELDKE
ncbi:hypothetical protein YpEc11_25 [Yersinia phage vB_YpEc11]|uniref:Phage protein n=1 Tax=Yersinia phage vB_YpEc11 TaxID=3056113 RepID=A0AA51VH93_9CAUD|nr:hypothetical protein YpEc11_25 [Yersinia phage vB_YpEc11]